MQAEAIEPTDSSDSETTHAQPQGSDYEEPRTWPYVITALLVLVSLLFLYVIVASINERIKYGSAETGWGLLAAVMLLGLPELALLVTSGISLTYMKRRDSRIFIGVGLLVALAVPIGLFGFEPLSILFGAHADGSPTVILH